MVAKAREESFALLSHYYFHCFEHWKFNTEHCFYFKLVNTLYLLIDVFSCYDT